MCFWFAVLADKKQPKQVEKMPEIRKNFNFVVVTIFFESRVSDFSMRCRSRRFDQVSVPTTSLMLGSCIIVASLPSPTNLISSHVILWPACFCRADPPEFAASCCRYPRFQFQRWLCICLKIVFTFFEKSFSYAGFEVRKIVLLCIRNTKIFTILSIQKLSNHDNQINKTKIWTMVILHSS